MLHPHTHTHTHTHTCTSTGTNPCALNNGGCTHLCLLSSVQEAGFTCACPDGTTLNITQGICESTPQKLHGNRNRYFNSPQMMELPLSDAFNTPSLNFCFQVVLHHHLQHLLCKVTHQWLDNTHTSIDPLTSCSSCAQVPASLQATRHAALPPTASGHPKKPTATATIHATSYTTAVLTS